MGTRRWHLITCVLSPLVGLAGCARGISLAGSAAPPRLVRTLNASPTERAALVEALEVITGEQWACRDCAPPPEYPRARLAELRGVEPLDAQYAAELLDEALEEPLLLISLADDSDGSDGSQPDGGDGHAAMDARHVASLVATHERTWGLRRALDAPSGHSPGGWTPDRATLSARVLFDGAAREDVDNGMLERDDAPADADSEDFAWDVSEVAVWDGVCDEPLRAALLELLQTGADFYPAASTLDPADEAAGPNPELWTRALVDRDDDPDGTREAPSSADGAALPVAPSWTLRPEVARRLCPPPVDTQHGSGSGDAARAEGAGRPAAIVEMERRLRALLGHCDVCFSPPPFAAVPLLGGDRDEEEEDEEEEDEDSVELDGSLGGSTPIVANAPQMGERFLWHIDGDPAQAAPSPWTDLHGSYPNRSPGRPRLVSALLYLNKEWDANAWGAPTRFRDPPTGAEVRVLPSPGRLVLMDQDATHTVTAPDVAAGAQRARFSLVWKLCLFPTGPTPPPGEQGGGAPVRMSSEPTARQARAAQREHVVGSACRRLDPAGRSETSAGGAPAPLVIPPP